jgi:hypothetical protein
MNEEILPRVVKLRPRIEKSWISTDPRGESRRRSEPDWSEMFSGSEEMFKTMEELTNLQMEGSDVYMSAFRDSRNLNFSGNSGTGSSRSILIMRLLIPSSGMRFSAWHQ